MITGSTLDHWCHTISDGRRKRPSGVCPCGLAVVLLLIIPAMPQVLRVIFPLARSLVAAYSLRL